MNDFGYEQVADQELVDTLDRLFPNARSREEIEHEGVTYRKRFVPAVTQGNARRSGGKLGGGRVTQWETYWEIKRKVSDFGTVEAKLDHYFPKAASKEVVVFEGKRYRREFSPVFSNSHKTIHR